MREGRLTIRARRVLLVLLLLSLLVPLIVAVLWGDVFADAAYQRYQKARAIARGVDPFWDHSSPLYTLSLSLIFRASLFLADDAASGLLPPVAATLGVLGWMVAIAAWFLIGLTLERPTFAVALAILLALNPLQARVLGLESGLVLGLFGLATLWAMRGKTAAMVVALFVLVAIQPMMFLLAVPLFVFSRIWRRSPPTLIHIAVLAVIGAVCYGLSYAVADPGSGVDGGYAELRLLVPLLLSAQILIATGFALLVPDFDWLVQPLRDKRALQRGIVLLGFVALVVWQGNSLLQEWRLRPADRLVSYRTMAEWLRDQTLPTETVGAAQAELLGYLSDRRVLELPDSIQTAALLAAIDALRPDYCVAQDSLVWHGVQSQPWFQQRYQPAFQLVNPYDSATPLTVFRYTPSPFDSGETVTTTARFTPDTEEWIELTGYRLDSQRLQPEEPLHLTLYWRAVTSVHQPLYLVVRLINAATGKVWAQMENLAPGGLATRFWNADVELADNYTLVPRADLPPGDYVWDVAFYRRDDDALPILAGAPGDVLRREPFLMTQISHPANISASPLTPDHSVEFTLGNEIELLGYDAPRRLSPGDTLRVALYWRALRSVPVDYKVFIHLLTPDDQLLAQDDAAPVNWSYPTTQWQVGEYIRDEHFLTIDPSALRGDYVLSIGLYDPATGERAIVRDATGTEITEGRIVLQQIQVR